MEQILIAVTAVLSLAVIGLLIWLITSTTAGREKIAAQSASIYHLQEQLDAIKIAQDKTTESVQQSLQHGQTAISQSMQAGQQVLAKLIGQIGELQGTNKQMLQLGSEVRRLQDILASPKLRGQMGEWSLETLLAQILPEAAYSLQHGFKDGQRVDALVRLADFAVPIDAKFPLPSFERFTNAESEDDKSRQRRHFQRDVIAHIDKIAAAYIRPSEGTLDFALMYIPAENIYYESIVKHPSDTLDILEYALDHKVIPVSPNLLYAYLMTVVMGLHGLQIEKQAVQIRQNLKLLNASFKDFTTSWDTLGSHIRNASNKYDDTQKKLDRFGLQLEHIQADEQPQPTLQGR